jgi:alkylhydroperoxidase/carboxymuconolactone decarboxylase family protein
MHISEEKSRAILHLAEKHGLIKSQEKDFILGMFNSSFPFAEAAQLANTFHAHIRVDRTLDLPRAAFLEAGAVIENEKDGYVKYAFPGGANLIFSSINVSQDDLRETYDNRRARPFLDHVGIDLRDETEEVRAAFDAVPGIAAKREFAHTAQGTPDKPVFCCHTNVSLKHWVYPGLSSPSIEFAFGALKIDLAKSGCDLRPSDPRLGAAPVSACGASATDASHSTTSSGGDGYYRPEDLGKFGEISQNASELGKKFFEWYGAVFADGALSAREKSIIALAVAHAVQCPYCIEAYTKDCVKRGLSLDQLTEAVHVAAAIRGGASLVHGMQMRHHHHH